MSRSSRPESLTPAKWVSRSVSHQVSVQNAPDGEHRSELLQALNDPAAPVFEVAAGVVIKAAEIRAPDTARYDVVPGGGVERDEGGAGLGHAGLLPWNLICPKATAAPPSVQAKWVSQRSFKRSGCPTGYP